MPAMVGGAALLADGILTPAVTVTTAIEGLRTIDLVHQVIGDSQSVVVAMLMTTALLTVFLSRIRGKTLLAVPFAIFFGAIEAFFFSSLTKFAHGGYVTVLLALAIFLVMYIWHRGTQIEMLQRINLNVEDYLDQLRTLSADEELPFLADNLVFLTNDLSSVDLAIIQAKYFIRRVCGSAAHWYGLQNSSLLFEDVPLFIGAKRQHKLAYVELPADTEE